MVKNPPATAGDARDAGSIPGSEKPPGEGNGNPLQYSCLENPIDTGAWLATVHGVSKGRTRLGMNVCVAAYFLEIIFSFCEEKEMCLLYEGIFNFIFISLNVL